MKRYSFLLIAFIGLLHDPAATRAAEKAATITVTGEVYQTKRATIEPLLKGASDGSAHLYDVLQRQERAFNSGTTVARLPEVKIKSGSGRKFAQLQNASLEVEPTLQADGNTINANTVVKIADKIIIGAIVAKNAEPVFLGTAEGATPDLVRIAFVRLVAGK